MNRNVIFRESQHAQSQGGVGIQIDTGAHLAGEFSAATQGYEFFEGIPESFIRALDDFNHGRIVSIETAHSDPPANA